MFLVVKSIQFTHNIFTKRVINKCLFAAYSVTDDIRLRDFSISPSTSSEVKNCLSLGTGNSKDLLKVNIHKQLKDLQHHESDTGSAAVQGYLSIIIFFKLNEYQQQKFNDFNSCR